PGEVVQLDIKGLGRLVRGGGRRGQGRSTAQRHREGVGWSQLHLAVDAASRQAYLELRPSVGSDDCIAFLRHAVAHFDALGIRVRRVLSDNGAGYKRRFREACDTLGVRHTRTQPYHPWTNGRVERFNRTLQSECVYAGDIFTSDEERRYEMRNYNYKHGNGPESMRIPAQTRESACAGSRRATGLGGLLGGGRAADAAAQARVQGVPKAVANEVEAKDGDEDHRARRVDEPRGPAAVLRGVRQHVPPRGDRRLDPEPEI
ncbi:MAG: transposase family protein, partial [Chloroflexi bacterium]